MPTIVTWVTVALVGLSLAQEPAPSPRPLDPIAPAEERAARRIAEADERTRPLLGSEYRAVYALSIAPKLDPKLDEPRGRHADLLYIRGDNAFGVRVLVDLVGEKVVSVEKVSPGSVPLGTSDAQEALRIALEDQAVQKLLGERAKSFRVLTGPIGPDEANSDFVEALRHAGAGADDPCRTHRCLFLLFNSGGRLILQDYDVLVDLNTRRTRVSSNAQGGRP